MKIFKDKFKPRDSERIPYIGETVMSGSEYVLSCGNKREIEIWMMLFKNGFSASEMDELIENRDVEVY